MSANDEEDIRMQNELKMLKDGVLILMCLRQEMFKNQEPLEDIRKISVVIELIEDRLQVRL